MKNKSQNIAIIGSGFSALSAACYLSKYGYNISIFEKNQSPGGRARQFTSDNGFVFDMGPSWYWMPDVIEKFFNDFDHTTSDFYELKKLDPQFQVIFSNQMIEIPDNNKEISHLFETIEKNSSAQFENFMSDAKEKYQISMNGFVDKPCLSWFEFLDFSLIKKALKLDLFTNFRKYTSRYFKNSHLKLIMEFPIIFLGASPNKIPAMYSLMNYGGYGLGTWYPMGGFYQIILAMKKIATNNGVKFHFNANIESINCDENTAQSITINQQILAFDYIISSADYYHTEKLLAEKYRNYTENYWSKKTFAPSCLIFYLGINQKIEKLKHHNLFFDQDFDNHINDIYLYKKWPDEPLFYVCCPSKTDNEVAPEACENLFLLMPIAINIEDHENIRNKYLDMMLERIEQKMEVQNLKSKIVYKKSYCIDDFKSDYNAYGGNAYGLANTLSQTAFFKPSIKNHKLKNLFYTGQLTVPGPGVPPSIISGKIVADEILKLQKL